MSYIVRFVGSRAKWRAYEEYAPTRDFDWRAYKEIFPREKENNPSIFVAEDADRILELVCLWAMSRDIFSTIDYVIISNSQLESVGIAFEVSPGGTGIEKLDRVHGELQLARGIPLCSLISDVVWTKGSVARASKETLVEQISRMILQGNVIEADLKNEDLKERVKAALDNAAGEKSQAKY